MWIHSFLCHSLFKIALFLLLFSCKAEGGWMPKISSYCDKLPAACKQQQTKLSSPNSTFFCESVNRNTRTQNEGTAWGCTPCGGICPRKIFSQSGLNQTDNTCLRICEPYGARSPFYLMQLSVVFSLSAMWCHTAARQKGKCLAAVPSGGCQWPRCADVCESSTDSWTLSKE